LIEKGVLAAGTALFFGLFYGLFSNRVIGGFYRSSLGELLLFLQRHSFYVFSSFLTTLAYILGIVFVYTGYFWIKKKDQSISFCRENSRAFTYAAVMTVTGVGMARILTFQDNAYQLAYMGYILAAFFIFVFWCHFSAAMSGGLFRAAGLVLFFCRLHPLQGAGRKRGYDRRIRGRRRRLWKPALFRAIHREGDGVPDREG